MLPILEPVSTSGQFSRSRPQKVHTGTLDEEQMTGSSVGECHLPRSKIEPAHFQVLGLLEDSDKENRPFDGGDNIRSEVDFFPTS
jgi:hypothetical protein